MITNNDTTNQIDPRQQALNEIERIESIANRSERWRAIQRFMFKMNPSFVEADQLHIAATNEKRLEQLSLTGSTKSGSMRQLYSMPEYLYRALQMMDPEFQRMQSDKDAVTVKKFNHQIWKTFPEYRVSTVI